MAKRTLKDVQSHVVSHGGTVQALTNGNYNIARELSRSTSVSPAVTINGTMPS